MTSPRPGSKASGVLEQPLQKRIITERVWLIGEKAAVAY